MRVIRKATGCISTHKKATACCLAIAVAALSGGSAVAHITSWRDGMSRIAGFGHCAKGPCMKRYDFSPTVRHAHLQIDGRHTVVMCTGLGRQNPDCPKPWQGNRK